MINDAPGSIWQIAALTQMCSQVLSMLSVANEHSNLRQHF